MRIVRVLYIAAYGMVTALFGACAVALVGLGAIELWHAVDPRHAVPLDRRFEAVLESIGLLTIAVVALELGQS